MTAPTTHQRRVIDYGLSPLRVAAGAGTGKTTTMAHRLAALVERTGISPDEALGVTFTNKAAGELADGLRHRLGGGPADREVDVTTYHGLAFRLLGEFGALVGVERDSRIITPGYSRQLLLESLALEDRPALDLTARGHRVDDLMTLAAQLGDNLLDAGAVAAVPPEQDDAWEQRTELGRVLSAYEARKRTLDLLDYADLILLAHRMVASFPQVAQRVRERYAVVLLDEYQDTNPAQRMLLRELFGGGFPVTAVGDADQTIYEWRGASRENFAGFPHHFPDREGRPAATLELRTNFRSDRSILRVANRIRDGITGADPAGALVAREDAGDGWVGVGWFRTAREEAGWIAREIVRLHEVEGTPWSEVAVLFRKNAQIPLVREALERAEVPSEVVSLGGLLAVPEVADLHAWLRILGRPDDGPALMRVLLGSRFRLGLGDLAPLAAWVEAQRRSAPPQEVPSLLEAIDRGDSDGDTATQERLAEFRHLYRSLLELAQGASLAQLCRRMLDALDVWAEVDALHGAARLSARLNLYRFLDLAEEWSPLEGRPSLDAFLDYLDGLADEAAPEELDTARVAGSEAVALLTVHRAKGLEWEAVFLPALVRNTFPAVNRRSDDPNRFPALLPYDMRLDSADRRLAALGSKELGAELRARHMDQEWRTAYVAVTRSRRRLYGTGAFWYAGQKPARQSELFILIAGTEQVESFWTVDEPGEAPEPGADGGHADSPDPHFSGGWRAALQQAAADPGWCRRAAAGEVATYDSEVEQLRMMLDGLAEPADTVEEDGPVATSVTGLVTYATCPRRFYWNEVDRLPRRPSTAARRGTELHRRIELHNRGKVALQEVRDDSYDLDPSEPAPGAGAFAAFLASRFARVRPRFVEMAFNLALDHGRVRGRIDAIYEHDGGGWEVVDFKSGRARPDPAARVQLEAYAVAAAEAGLAPEPPPRLTVTFAYLGHGLEEVSEQADATWRRRARSHLEELTGAIEAKRFDPQPSAACRACDFARFCDAGRTWLDAND